MGLVKLIELFELYFDPETEKNDWVERSLVKDAPQSAIDAFEEFKRLETEFEKEREEARKRGIIYN